MCDAAVREDFSSFQLVPDWFMTQQQTELWHNDDCNDEKRIEWYDGYKKRKAKEAKI